MGDVIEQAADVIRQIGVEQGDDIDCCDPYAEGLLEAGLLRSDTDQAVLDAADSWELGRDVTQTPTAEYMQLLYALVEAVRARRSAGPQEEKP